MWDGGNPNAATCSITDSICASNGILIILLVSRLKKRSFHGYRNLSRCPDARSIWRRTDSVNC